MRLTYPVDDLFSSPSHAKVLRALTALPEGMTAGVREIGRRAGVSHPTASRVLDSLRRQGVVHVKRSPANDAYLLNANHDAVEVLTELFLWERSELSTVVALLTREIVTRAPWVSQAYLFGSAARGEMEVHSDLDVACVCPPGCVPEMEAIGAAIDDVIAERLGNHLGLLIGTRPVEEMTRVRGRTVALWRQVEAEGIQLIPATPKDA